MRAIENGAHAAPFDVLGVQRGANGRLLRVNAPGAWRVEARSRRDHSVLAILDQSDTPGLFSAPFEDDAPYLLRIYWPGRIEEREDPYSFPSTISDDELRALRDTRLAGAGDVLGARIAILGDVPGVRFALWAPDAASVAVAGDFNEWSDRRHPMRLREGSGVWELFVPRVAAGARYCFAVRRHGAGRADEECEFVVDPMARAWEAAPRPAAIVAGAPRHVWRDDRFLAIRRARRDCAPPVSIYRVAPDAWLAQDGGGADWPALARGLIPYVCALGFTHVQIGGSRGLGGAPAWMFAPPPAQGDADAFAAFVDACHEGGLGLIIEWDAPASFASVDAAQWDALRHNLLAASAMHWLATQHVDGLSFTPPPGAGELLNRLRGEIAEAAPGALLIVEDALEAARPYASLWRDDLIRAALTADAGLLGAQTASRLEGAVAAVTPRTLSGFVTDEAADDPLAPLRAAYAFAWMMPGAKLMHMGAEFGQRRWQGGAVDWEALDDPRGRAFLMCVRDLNDILRSEAPVRLTTRATQEIKWLDAGERSGEVVAYLRTGEAAAPLLVAMNVSGAPRTLEVEAPGGFWRELINSDSRHYGGADRGNCGGVHASPQLPGDGTFRLQIVLPPCGTIIFRNES